MLLGFILLNLTPILCLCRNIADENRFIIPDELEAIMAKAAKEAQEVTSDSIEEPQSGENPQLGNMIDVPVNRPKEQKLGSDGVYRERF